VTSSVKKEFLSSSSLAASTVEVEMSVELETPWIDVDKGTTGRGAGGRGLRGRAQTTRLMT
jgi:hypothetical protein